MIGARFLVEKLLTDREKKENSTHPYSNTNTCIIRYAQDLKQRTTNCFR